MLFHAGQARPNNHERATTTDATTTTVLYRDAMVRLQLQKRISSRLGMMPMGWELLFPLYTKASYNRLAG